MQTNPAWTESKENGMFVMNPTATGIDRRAVSPVIGVVMMVAITVILTGVIAAFVLGFGAETKAPPQASLALEQNSTGEIVIMHLGGDTIDLDEVFLRGDVDLDSSIADVNEDDAIQLRGGESIAVPVTGIEPDGLVTVVWDVGEDAAILAEYRWLEE